MCLSTTSENSFPVALVNYVPQPQLLLDHSAQVERKLCRFMAFPPGHKQCCGVWSRQGLSALSGISPSGACLRLTVISDLQAS